MSQALPSADLVAALSPTRGTTSAWPSSWWPWSWRRFWLTGPGKKLNEDVEPASPEELLAAFEEARSEGELDEEEYATGAANASSSRLQLAQPVRTAEASRR